jgi:HSP20 family protein
MNTLVRNANTLNGLPAIFNEIFNEAAHTPNKTAPAANIIEDEASFKIELAIPGFKKEDLKIEVRENTLKVWAEKEENKEEKTETYLRKEFGFETFSRSFRLPKTVETDAIAANYDHGVLTLSIPKKEEAKPKEPKLISVN